MSAGTRGVTMRTWACLALVLAAACWRPAGAEPVEAPPATYPTLPANAMTAEGFAPAGWAVESQSSGDLNGDGRPDLAIVLRGRDPHLVIANSGMGAERIDSNPRVLAVAFAEARGGYRLAAQNHALIPRMNDATMQDWMANGAVSATGGVLRVSMSLSYSGGSWESSSYGFAFRFQHGRFELIGYDHGTLLGNTGATTDLSINYSTRQVVRISGNEQSDRPGPQRRSRLPARPTTDLDHIGSGIEFDPGVPG